MNIKILVLVVAVLIAGLALGYYFGYDHGYEKAVAPIATSENEDLDLPPNVAWYKSPALGIGLLYPTQLSIYEKSDTGRVEDTQILLGDGSNHALMWISMKDIGLKTVPELRAHLAAQKLDPAVASEVKKEEEIMVSGFKGISREFKVDRDFNSFGVYLLVGDGRVIAVGYGSTAGLSRLITEQAKRDIFDPIVNSIKFLGTSQAKLKGNFILEGSTCAGFEFGDDPSRVIWRNELDCYRGDTELALFWLDEKTFVTRDLDQTKLNSGSAPRVSIYTIESYDGKTLVVRNPWTGWGSLQESTLRFTKK